MWLQAGNEARDKKTATTWFWSTLQGRLLGSGSFGSSFMNLCGWKFRVFFLVGR